MLINFEGLDGVGKTTLIHRVSMAVPNSVLTKEPGSPLAETNKQIRKMVLEDETLSPMERELLFYVDASAHKREISIRRRSARVLCDRGIFSHLAYLRGYLKTKKIDFEQYALCKKLIEQCCATPNAVIYLRGSLELMRIRTANKKKDVIESNPPVFYHHVLDTYEDLVANCPYRLLILEATDSIDTNTHKVLSFLQEESLVNVESED